MTKNVKLTEKELLTLLQQQDANAFSYLYDQYAPLIFGIILRQVKNDRLASEILKITFVNIFKECKNLNCVKQSLFTWLLSLTKKTASSGFKVNIDLKLLLNQKDKVGNYLHNNNHHEESLHPPALYINLNPLIG